MIRLLCALALCGIAMPVYGQLSQGTDFWLGFMEHVDISGNSKVLLISSEHSTSGMISLPLKDWNQSFTVKPGIVTTVFLPHNAETLGSERKDNTGIHVTSQHPISVYAHQYANARSEAALILPTPALGKEYYAMSYKGYIERGVPYPSEFLAVAVTDGTEIYITMSDRTPKTPVPGTTRKVTLNRGETFQVHAVDENGDLTGSHLVSNKPFAVFSGNVWTQVPGGCIAPDNLYEQMYPLRHWGEDYFAMPSHKADFNLLRILASENQTTVRINGKMVKTLNSGKFIDHRFSDEPVSITSNKPILVAQYLSSHECNTRADLLQGDPSMFLLNHLQQTSRKATFYASPYEKISSNFISVLARTADVNTVILDGDTMRGFKRIRHMPNYSYVNLQVFSGIHHLEAEGCGFIAYCYGYGQLESYAYATSLGFRVYDEYNNPIPEGGCLGDTFVFHCGVDMEVVKPSWRLGDGTRVDSSFAIHAYERGGTYNVSLILENYCLNRVDTIVRKLTVTPPLELETMADTTVCAGTSVHLKTAEREEGVIYHWSGPNDFYTTAADPMVLASDGSYGGEYTVIATGSSCYSLPGKLQLTVRDLNPKLGRDTSLCPGDQLFLNADTTLAQSFLWQDGSTHPRLRVYQAGVYKLEVRDEFGCEGSDSVQIFRKCPPAVFLPPYFTPDGDGRNDFFGASIDVDFTNYELWIFTEDMQLVFHTNDPAETWDGTYAGEDLPPDAFRWRLSFREQDQRTGAKDFRQEGWVELVRGE